MRCQRAESPPKLDRIESARAFFAGCFAEDPGRESLWVAHLDGEARCLHLSRHSGDAGQVNFPLRTIIVDAARHGTAAILLAHNHPSGDPTPSESDLRSTRRLAITAEPLGCRIVDHLVFAGPEYASLRSLGYL